MEEKKSKSLIQYIRIWHRDIGFFVFGLVVVYALSGILLMYRNTDFMQKQVTMEKQLKPGLAVEDLAKELRMREIKITKTEGEIVSFENGYYNQTSGAAVVTVKELMFPFNKLTDFHKAISLKATHWFNLVFGALLLFMAISSLWMFKPGSKTHKRGLILAGAGILFTVLILLF
jgi:hypothetical protein